MASGAKIAACVSGTGLVLLGLIFSFLALGPEGQIFTVADSDTYKISQSVVYAACFTFSPPSGDDSYKCVDYDFLQTEQPKNKVAALVFYILEYLVAIATMIVFMIALCTPKAFGLVAFGMSCLNALLLLIANSFQTASYTDNETQLKIFLRGFKREMGMMRIPFNDWKDSTGWSCIVPWVGLFPAVTSIGPAAFLAFAPKI